VSHGFSSVDNLPPFIFDIFANFDQFGFFNSQDARHKIAEEITPLLPEILGVNDPVVQRMSFDVAPIYEQLILEEKEGGAQLSNLSELSIKTHGDEANLYLRYKGSAFVQFLDRLNEFLKLTG